MLVVGGVGEALRRVTVQDLGLRTGDRLLTETLTVRDSSLSASTQAVIAAEVGHLELAYGYFGEAAMIDLDDLEHNTRDGLHIASLAGAWTVAVAGLGGMRDYNGSLTFAPRLSPATGSPRVRPQRSRAAVTG